MGLLRIQTVYTCTAIVVTGCVEPDPTGPEILSGEVLEVEYPPSPVEISFGSLTVVVEDLGPADFAQAVEGTTRIVTADGVARIANDARPSFTDTAGEVGRIAGTWNDDGSLLLSIDGVLSNLSGGVLDESRLADVVPMPAESLYNDGQAIWIGGSGRLLRVQDEEARELIIDASIDDWTVDTSGLAWLTAPTLMGVSLTNDSVEVVEHLPDRVIHEVSVDSERVVWGVDSDRDLHIRNGAGAWVWAVMPDEVERIDGHPWARETWLRTTDGKTYVAEGGEFWLTDAPAGEWMGVDESGRLLQLVDGALQRVSQGRPVAFDGLRPGAVVSIRQSVTAVLTSPVEGEMVSAWADGLRLDLSDEGRMEIEPSVLTQGEHLLRVVRSSTDGTFVSTLPFRTGELPEADWFNDIEPLARRNCFACHATGTEPSLEIKEEWRFHIDTIVEQTTSGAMPPGEGTLTDDQLLLLRGWRAAGFP